MLQRAAGDSKRWRWLWTVVAGESLLGFCLGCAPASPAEAPRSQGQTPRAVPTVVAAPPPDRAPAGTAPASAAQDGFPEVERAARALFGKMIGPEFAQYDEASLAPPGYTWRGSTGTASPAHWSRMKRA